MEIIGIPFPKETQGSTLFFITNISMFIPCGGIYLQRELQLSLQRVDASGLAAQSCLLLTEWSGDADQSRRVEIPRGPEPAGSSGGRGHFYLHFGKADSQQRHFHGLFSWTSIHPVLKNLQGLPWWLSGKESACRCRRHEFGPWSRKIPHVVPIGTTIAPQ